MSFSWSNPYAWPRKPVLAPNIVATSQPLASGVASVVSSKVIGGSVEAPFARSHALCARYSRK